MSNIKEGEKLDRADDSLDDQDKAVAKNQTGEFEFACFDEV
jgi:hypothetical protein